MTPIGSANRNRLPSCPWLQEKPYDSKSDIWALG